MNQVMVQIASPPKPPRPYKNDGFATDLLDHHVTSTGMYRLAREPYNLG